MSQPLKDYSIERCVDGVWSCWMIARGKSVKQIVHAVWWRSNGNVAKADIRAQRTDGWEKIRHPTSELIRRPDPYVEE